MIATLLMFAALVAWFVALGVAFYRAPGPDWLEAYTDAERLLEVER